nr:hypothetical protein [Tanacetum cinerariifolium]
GEVVSADDVIPADVSVSADPIDDAAAVSLHSETEFALMGLSTEAVPPPLTGNYMPPFNISDIDESHMMYGKKATDSSKIKTNDDSISHSHDYVLFYFSDSYLHLIQDCDFHEQTFAKRNAKRKGILKSRPTGKPVNPNKPKPVSAGRPKPVSTGRPNPVFADQPNPVSAV